MLDPATVSLVARYQLDRSDAIEKAPNNVLAIFWTMFAVFILATALAGAATFAMTTATTQKMQGYVSTAILATAATAYWCMSTAEGQVTVNQGPNDNEGQTREFFYVRYIMYILITPLTFFQLQVLATCDFYSTAFYTYSSIAVIVCRLVGALDGMNYRWGWFVLSWLWFIPVVHQIAGNGRRSARQVVEQGYVSGRLYGPLGSVLVCSWTMYGIIWGFAEGGNTIPLSAEIAWYAATDLAAIVLYQLLMIWTMRKVDRVARGAINLRSNENMTAAQQV